ERFRADPARYVSQVKPDGPLVGLEARPGMAPKAGIPAPPGRVEYTCPMHPDVIRSAPGACPICGMALDVRTMTAVDGPTPGLWARWFAVCSGDRWADRPDTRGWTSQ